MGSLNQSVSQSEYLPGWLRGGRERSRPKECPDDESRNDYKRMQWMSWMESGRTRDGDWGVQAHTEAR